MAPCTVRWALIQSFLPCNNLLHVLHFLVRFVWLLAIRMRSDWLHEMECSYFYFELLFAFPFWKFSNWEKQRRICINFFLNHGFQYLPSFSWLSNITYHGRFLNPWVRQTQPKLFLAILKYAEANCEGPMVGQNVSGMSLFW
jgi:hypothetical protein